jgi:hypothetical protein
VDACPQHADGRNQAPFIRTGAQPGSRNAEIRRQRPNCGHDPVARRTLGGTLERLGRERVERHAGGDTGVDDPLHRIADRRIEPLAKRRRVHRARTVLRRDHARPACEQQSSPGEEESGTKQHVQGPAHELCVPTVIVEFGCP